MSQSDLKDLLNRGLRRRAEIAAAEYPSEVQTVSFEQLDFHISANRPCLLPSLLRLDLDVLLTEILETKISVAVTPNGNADAPLGEYFAKPFVEQMTVAMLLTLLEARAAHESPHYYMQSQDDNINKEFSHIPQTMVPRKLNLPGCKLLGPVEAINLWIGGIGTVSRMHSDNYDNIYIQLRGTKRIWLIPPAEVDVTEEKFLKAATYHFENGKYELREDTPATTVLFPTQDPRDPQFSPQTMFIVDLEPGQVLYMPALWYHQVEIIDDKVNVSLNYWHSPNPSEHWANWDFMRWVSLSLRGEYDEAYFAEPEI